MGFNSPPSHFVGNDEGTKSVDETLIDLPRLEMEQQSYSNAKPPEDPRWAWLCVLIGSGLALGAILFVALVTALERIIP